MANKKLLQMPMPAPATHKCVQALQDNVIECFVIGCGGNGAQMLTKLARLDHALRSCGHNGGIKVTAFDPDIVTTSNEGRQLFSPADVGHHKATLLITRLNAYYGLDWHARNEMFGGDAFGFEYQMPRHLLITCVDSAKSRRIIHTHIEDSYSKPFYWLDMGNMRDSGQVILGQPKNTIATATASQLGANMNLNASALLERNEATRLPIVTEIFPELLNPKLKEDNEPSCSLADALTKQSLFVNDMAVTLAAQLLDALLRGKEITHHGYFFDLASGRVNPLPVPAEPAQAVKPAKRTKRAATASAARTGRARRAA